MLSLALNTGLVSGKHDMIKYKNKYRFTMDFNCSGGSFANIAHLVNTYGIPNTICEVGVYEGSTTFWMADNLTPYNKNLQIYAIDSHNGSNDMPDDFIEIKKTFEKNLLLNPYNNVTYINKKSEDGLIDLINKNVKFDFIYIDGDHRAGTVLTDLTFAWKTLNVGGVILCDDAATWKFIDKNNTASNQMSPRLAIETFIQCNWHKLNILALPYGTQTAFIKLQI